MTITSKVRSRVKTPEKIERIVNLGRHAAADGSLPLWIVVKTIGPKRTKEEHFQYRLSRLDVPVPAFRLVRVDPKPKDGEADHYDVLLDEGLNSSCECHGFLRWGHCKHLSALQKLQECNRI